MSQKVEIKSKIIKLPGADTISHFDLLVNKACVLFAFLVNKAITQITNVKTEYHLI